MADLPTDLIYTGALSNADETLELTDPGGELVDGCNAAGGPWPAGNAESRASVERQGATDLLGSWGTFTGRRCWLWIQME